MRTTALALLVLSLGTSSLTGQRAGPVTVLLPGWADSALVNAGLGAQFDLSSTLNPELVWADFDGDGFFDLAVAIVDRDGLRRGIAIVHRVTSSVHLLGAGHRLGNGRDDVSASGSWGVTSGSGHGGFARASVFVAEWGLPTVHAVWDGDAYRWLQADL